MYRLWLGRSKFPEKLVESQSNHLWMWTVFFQWTFNCIWWHKTFTGRTTYVFTVKIKCWPASIYSFYYKKKFDRGNFGKRYEQKRKENLRWANLILYRFLKTKRRKENFGQHMIPRNMWIGKRRKGQFFLIYSLHQKPFSYVYRNIFLMK